MVDIIHAVANSGSLTRRWDTSRVVSLVLHLTVLARSAAGPYPLVTISHGNSHKSYANASKIPVIKN